MIRKNKQSLTFSKLEKRGWTKALIKRILGDPDEVKLNPYRRSGPRMRLYETKRVEQAEASPEFLEAQEKRKPKREAAQKGLATKKQKIADYVKKVKIKVPKLPKKELIQQACQDYNARSKGDNWASEHADQEFLERISVNYLRHCLTSYEDELRKIAGRVNADEAYLELKEKVLDAIAKRYKWLGDECCLQVERMWDQEYKRI
jgi:hypothetical protein